MGKKNPFEILDKINSYNTNNKFPSSHMNRGFKKPGFTPMGYSQRAMYDKNARNTYGNLKYSKNKRKPSRNNLLPIKSDPAAYENIVGSNGNYKNLEDSRMKPSSSSRMSGGIKSRNSGSI